MKCLSVWLAYRPTRKAEFSKKPLWGSGGNARRCGSLGEFECLAGMLIHREGRMFEEATLVTRLGGVVATLEEAGGATAMETSRNSFS